MKREEIDWLFVFFFGLTLLAVALTIAVICGCSSHQPLTPGQIAATQPVNHPINNINQVISHSQTTLEVINIPAFLAALVGVGLAVFGLLEADKAVERIGLVIGIVAGVVTLGTLAGIIVLPFLPWIILTGFAGGVGYGVYLLVHKLTTK